MHGVGTSAYCVLISKDEKIESHIKFDHQKTGTLWLPLTRLERIRESERREPIFLDSYLHRKPPLARILDTLAAREREENCKARF